MNRKSSKNIKTVLAILQNEVDGDVSAALKKMDSGYSMTWMYQTSRGTLFPTTKKDTKSELKEVYPIKGREYDIKNIAENNNTVFLELIESYPDPKTKKVYRTPLVIVLEMKNGKIKTGRHYCDPRISSLYLSKKNVDKAYRALKSKKKIH